jgi:hypothetical protein
MRTSNLNKLRRLSSNDRRLLFESVVLLPLIHAGLSLMGYHRLRARLEKLFPLKTVDPSTSDPTIVQRAWEITRVISIAAQYGIYRASCLRRALLLWGLLRREGIESRLCFGVRVFEGRLEAHAWVDYNGNAINDSTHVSEQYQVLQEALPSTQWGL